MNIQEYADILNLEIDIKYHPNQGGRWTAKLSSVEIKEGNFLTSAYGYGASVSEAIMDCVRVIKGKRIVHRAYGDDRREFDVPLSLTV